MDMTNFHIGDKVKLTNEVLHKEYAGLIGIVKKLIKRRNIVQVVLADGQIYEAHPQNVQHIKNDTIE